ncbi:MAG: hypothetical protein DMD54_00325 [Gemmatimonadetes bacterium]|nr:MAG: hypothetical protein DMD54_00325 [Gemmatimonadota bacterium]
MARTRVILSERARRWREGSAFSSQKQVLRAFGAQDDKLARVYEEKKQKREGPVRQLGQRWYFAERKLIVDWSETRTLSVSAS